MVLGGGLRTLPGRAVRDRITWVAQTDGTVRQIWDVSEDGGRSWSTIFTGIYRRIPP